MERRIEREREVRVDMGLCCGGFRLSCELIKSGVRGIARSAKAGITFFPKMLTVVELFSFFY